MSRSAGTQLGRPALPLRAAQSFVQIASTHPGSVRAGIAAAIDALGIAGASLESIVTAGPRLSALERLAIYHHGYRARLVACLADDYPALKYALGPRGFERLAHAYIAAYPSRSPNLNVYGRHMTEHCRLLGGRRARFLSELAALEWALVEAVHAAPSPPLELGALERLSSDDWAAARLVPSASLSVLRFDYPVNAFFQSFSEERAPRSPRRKASAVAVYRSGTTIWRADLSSEMASVLAALAGGKPLGQALLELEQRAAQRRCDIGAWFRDWIQSGLFCGVATNRTPRTA